ncbi:MAG: NAD-dependent epimerase/dehydratase family protein [Dehalococcoidia bacterium]
MSGAVLITGVGGLVGYHLALRCLGEGARIRGMGRHRNQNIEDLSQHPAFTFVQGDIADPEPVGQLLAEGADIVYHLAGQPFVWFANRHREEDFRVNAFGTLRLLEAVAKGGVPRLVFASTGEVYGDVRLPTEETPPQPTNFYGLGKLVAEMYVQQYRQHAGLEYSILRISLVYGPRMYRNVLYDLLAGALSPERRIRLVASLDSAYDLVYVEDVVDVLLRTQENGWRDTVVNISSGVGTPVRDLISLVGQELSMPDIQIEVAENPSPVEKVLANGRALALGWRPQWALAEGVRAVIASMRAADAH